MDVPAGTILRLKASLLNKDEPPGKEELFFKWENDSLVMSDRNYGDTVEKLGLQAPITVRLRYCPN